METKARGGFTSNLGFILAAAGSAVGLGNLWRFPYLVAKDGGGLFLLIYILLVLTFGFTLMTTEIAIGRKTGLAPLKAYDKIDKRFGFLGWLATIVPMVIFPYYCVIGGWITKYAATYSLGGASDITGQGAGNFFNSFITAKGSPILWFFVFMAISAVIVLLGVEKGIEKASKILMPALLIIILIIAVFSLTLSYTDELTGEKRTALQGLKIYFVPNFDGITVSKFLSILLDAVGQLFYSLSIGMGIMVAYGSYAKKGSNLAKSINHIEIFDTGIAVIAGMIIVPTVYAFQGVEGLAKSGPSLMFISLPTIFEKMGTVGIFVGAAFFLLVLFAALTSALSLLEAVVSSIIDSFKCKRPLATLIAFGIATTIGLVVCLGYNTLYADIPLPNGSTGQILDVLDYITNSLLLPVVALITCVMIGWFCKPKVVIDEVKDGMGNKRFYREKLYIVMIKFIAPALLFVILLQAFNLLSFLG